MRAIRIPATVAEYCNEFRARALPDDTIASHDFYRRLIGWVLDHRAPLLYEQDHPDEYTNLSINFNWLLLRDYSSTRLGPPDTVLTMYVVHELAHMTHWLPTRFDDLSAGEYADQFTRSEYRASNETEILIHYRIPSVRERVFPEMRIVFDALRERGIDQPTMARLCNLRALFVEDTVLDGFFGDDDAPLAARFKKYGGNRAWARDRFAAIAPHFTGHGIRQTGGLTHEEYEPVLSAYEPCPDQARYERLVMDNVSLGFAMCGLPIPTLPSFADAIAAAAELEGRHAIVQS